LLPKEEFIDNETNQRTVTPEKNKKLSKRPVLKHYRPPKMVEMAFSRVKTPASATTTKLTRPGVVSMIYNQELDLLISGYEDSKIRIWGFNEETAALNIDMTNNNEKENGDLPNEKANSRVAGMSLKATLNEHRDAVIAMVCINKDGAVWLVSKRLIRFPPDGIVKSQYGI
jgi:hypothetical protein